MAAALLLAAAAARGGEISGLPPHLVPTIDPDYRFFLGNDFLAPGTNDDFRTQQIISTARFGERWTAVLDHSMLTRADAIGGPPARIDLMSLSLGFDLLREYDENRSRSLTLGAGARAVGNFEGARVQNGFHALIGSGISFLPYADTRTTDATLWLLAERHALPWPSTDHGSFAGWRAGYWLRAGALATGDGQLDAVAGLYAVASRPGLDLWLGVRRDWRDGYDADIVQIETSAEESKAAVAWGLRWGSLVVETVHRLDSFASYGQVSFVSSNNTRGEPSSRNSRADLQFGLNVPQMTFQLASRWHTRLLTETGSDWRESVLIDLRGGRPQLGRDVRRFVETAQLALGLEWSRSVACFPEWLRVYFSAAAGWRSEQLVGRGRLSGVRSEAVGRAVLQADAGLEIDATRIRDNWRHRLRIGVTGWRPASTATLSDQGVAATLHEPGASISVVWVLGFHHGR